MGSPGGVKIVRPAPRTISDSVTQAEVQAVNDGLVATLTLLNELHADVAGKDMLKAGLNRECPTRAPMLFDKRGGMSLVRDGLPQCMFSCILYFRSKHRHV